MKLILGHFYSYMLASKSSSYVFLFMLLYVLCAQPSHAADLPKVIRKHSNVSAKLGAPVKPRVETGGALQNTSVDTDAFISIWEVYSANQSITIPAVGKGFYFSVTWEKENNPAIAGGEYRQTQSLSISLPEAGRYRVKISGDYPHFLLNSSESRARFREVAQWGSISWKSMKSSFSEIPQLLFTANDAPDLSQVKDMSMMFKESPGFNGDLSSWNVSNVTDMSEMFKGAVAFNQPLNDWNVSKVTKMSEMFMQAEAFNQPLKSWNVSKVTDMSKMFNEAFSFNQPLNDWDVSAVKKFDSMFAIATGFDSSLANWKPGLLAPDGCSMVGVFLNSKFNQDLSSWDVSNVRDMENFFRFTENFNQDLSSWDVSKVTNMNYMFWWAHAFNQDLGAWNISSVVKLKQIFVQSKLSTANYDKTLIGWAALGNALQKDVILDNSGLTWCMSKSARDYLENVKDWTIKDDVQKCEELTPGRIIYVKKNATGNGNGSTWSNAFRELGDALAWAAIQTNPSWTEAAPLHIYVSKGVYKPTKVLVSKDMQDKPTTNRDKSFLLVKNVQVFGGFNGDDNLTDLNKRSFQSNNSHEQQHTILTGRFNDNAGNENNAHHVVVALGNLGVAKLDGLSIRAGRADGLTNLLVLGKEIPRSSGAGLYLDGASLLMENVVVEDNWVQGKTLSDTQGNGRPLEKSVYGGGIYARDANLNFKNVIFQNNKAEFDVFHPSFMSFSAVGAGLYLSNSTSDFYGVRLLNNVLDFSSTQEFNYSAFGAGLFNNQGNLSMRKSTIENNKVVIGAYSTNASKINAAGAGVYVTGNLIDLTEVQFKNNNITASAVSAAEFSLMGAGMYNAGIRTSLKNVDFIGNSIGFHANSYKFSIYRANAAGLYNNNSVVDLVQVKLVGNKVLAPIRLGSQAYGAAMFNYGSSPVLINCLVNQNIADSYAGGIYNTAGSNPKIYNTILFGNKVVDKEENITNSTVLPKSTPEFKHSFVGGAYVWDTAWGANIVGNIVSQNKPFVTNDTEGNYSLSRCSEVVNAGLNELFPGLKSNSLDRAGQPRVYIQARGSKIDMGPFEFQQEAMDFSAVKMLPAEYIYDGKGKTIKATGLPVGITASYLLMDAADNIITEAKISGVYKVIATLHGCNPDRVLAPVTLTINKAPLTITARAPSKVYDAYPYQLPVKLYYDGFVNDEDETVLGGTLSYEGSGKDVMDVGSYEVYPVGLTADNYEITVVAAAFDISKAVLGSLDFHGASYVYDGTAKSVLIGRLPELDVLPVYVGNGQTEAGTYTVTASISNARNYNDWSRSTQFEITKAPITGIDFKDASHVYDGRIKGLSYDDVLPAGVTVKGYTNNENTEVGEHTVTLNLDGGDNYEDLSLTATLRITKATLTGINFKGASHVYDTKPKPLVYSDALPTGVTVKGYLNNEHTNVGDYTVTLQLDGGANYEDFQTTATLKITKATLTGIDFKDASHVYDSKPKTLVYSDALPSGVTVKGYLNNEHTDVGDYTVTLQLDGGANYADFQTTATLKITKATLTDIDFKDASHVYDSKPKSLVYSDALPSGVTVKGYANNLHTNVGDYTVTLQLDGGPNYEDFQTTARLIITKATLTGIDFQDASHVYDSKPKSLVYSDALPAGVTVKGYTNNENTEVGEHTVTLNLDGGDNYEDLSLTATLRITKATLTGINFKGASHVYDTKPKSLVYSDALPTGVTVKGYLNNEHTNVGDYTVTLQLDGGANYEDFQTTATLKITKATLTGIDFKDASHVYDSKPKTLVYSDALPSGVTVKGYANNLHTNVGDYTVTLQLDGGANYADFQTTATLKITKATLTGIDFKDASHVYDSKPKTLVYSSALPTGVTVKGYLNNEHTDVGDYSVTLNLDGGDNYEDLSLTAKLIITKAPITGIDFKGANYVYDTKPKSLVYSDALPFGVTVKGYSNNENTEVGEYTVTLNLDGGDNYEDLSLTATLNITKATMGTFDFQAASYVYDGKPKSLVFNAELPAGATVDSYANNQQTEVGTYTVTAYIKGGRNYKDYQQPAQLTITKAILTGLDLKDESFEYDGKAKSLALIGKLPVGVSIKQYLGNAQTETGNYTVTVALDGGNNYEPWSTTAVMTITPFNQVLSFAKITPVGRDAGVIQLDLKSNSPLPIQLYSDNHLVATVTGDTELSILGVGTSNIRAEQAGNANYSSAQAQEQLLEVLHKQGSKLPVYLHQAVSPNGDGINDFLRIEGIENYPENKLAIYDANGKLLKEIVSYNNTTNNFEGIRIGGVVRNGTYFYVLTVKVAGKWMHDKGFFVIKE